MIPIKEYIGSLFIGKTLHFKCDCLIPIDVIGTVREYEVVGHDIVLYVETGGRIIHIGLNTPSLQIDII